MVTVLERKAFVLKNFSLVYQNLPKIDTIVWVPDLSDGYFENTNHFEGISIQWIDYKGESIPALFAGSKTLNEPFVFRDGKIEFQFDIISAIFFFLSGWQETVVESQDKLGRFTYKESIQKYLNISSLPVVNYYYLILKDAFEKAFNIQLINKLNPDGKFNAIISHDIDYWESLWKKELKFALKKCRLIESIYLIINKLFENDLGKSFERIASFQNKYGFKSTYFFLPDTREYLGNESADYDLRKPKYASFIKQIGETNAVGLHGSFTSHQSDKQFKLDLNATGSIFKARTNRYHFLMFNIRSTPGLLQKNGIEIDSTLAFNDQPGFRFGTSYPFYLFDYEQNIANEVLEFPLVVMDVSLFLNHYLNCKSMNEAWSYLEPILSHLTKTGGNLVLNWHNDSFMQLGREIWIQTFEKILQYCSDNQVNFKTLNDF